MVQIHFYPIYQKEGIREMTKIRNCMTKALCLVLLALLMLSPLAGFITVDAASDTVLSDDLKLMGYGYNVTAGVPLEGATSLNLASPILDMTDPELLAAVATFEIGSHTKANSTSSASAREMASSIGSVIGGGLNIGISMVSADINFLFQRNTYSEKTVQEYFEYYYEEIVRRAVIIQMPVSEIKEHLSEAFLNDLKEIDSPKEAEALIAKYGTHLMTGYNLGGRLSFTNYRQSTSASEELQTNIDLKAKIGASVKTVSGGVDFSFGEQFTNREFTETATSEYSFQSIGGEAITALTIDHVFQYNPSALDGKGVLTHILRLRIQQGYVLRRIFLLIRIHLIHICLRYTVVWFTIRKHFPLGVHNEFSTIGFSCNYNIGLHKKFFIRLVK